MAGATAGGDAWRIAGEDRAKHDAQFFQLKPVNGFISGDQARGFFMQSGLPTPVLGQIWGLADMNGDGKMDKKEFSIAMHLIKKKLQGYELPKSLPHSLKADPSPVMGSFGVTMSQPGVAPVAPGMGMPAFGMAMPVSMPMGSRMPMMTNGMPGMVGQPGFMGAPAGGTHPAGGFTPPPTGMVGKPGPTTAPAGGGSMAMPHPSKLKYTQLFNANDRNKKGALTGVEARAILVQTGVPQQMLAQIWNLSDVDKDGKLNCDEFCIAMHLIDLLKMGQMLPAKLPAELLPGKARSGSFGAPPPAAAVPAAPAAQAPQAFGDLLGSMGMPPPVQPTTNGEAKTEEAEADRSPFTFEDRRKENFDKGQAELERRRQMLQEQMRKADAERQEKERREQEKRERQRQEQEMKKQQEMERQLERQRQIEQQKEEQRRKMMEQREAARRELDRQRQMEWERQRKEQLMAEKAREYGQLSSLKSQTSNLKCELESLQGKKIEIVTKISQVRNGVTDFTAHIEAMRSTRDLKLAGIEQLQKDLQELTQKLQAVQGEREALNLRVQTSVQSNPVSETHRTMMHSVELKKTSVQRMKKDLEQIERDTEGKLSEIDTYNSQVNDMNNNISRLQQDISQAEKQKQDGQKQSEEQDRIRKEKDKHEKLRKELEQQRLKEELEKKQKDSQGSSKKSDGLSNDNWFNFGGDPKPSANNDNWASVFDSQPSAQSTADATSLWAATASSQVKSAPTTTTASSTKIKLSGPTQKYKAVYQFDARNDDELSVKPGDIVNVYVDQSGAEPGWKGGEMSGASGWFPEAYVEKMEEQSSQSTLSSDSGVSSGSQMTQVGSMINSSEDSSFMVVPGKAPAVSPTPGQGQVAPEGLQAQALYPWKAKKENHLTFNKGDIIGVREQQDMWWSGEINGKVGWFPKSYVKLISGPASSSSLTNSPSLTPTGTLEKKAGSARQSPAQDKTEGADQYQAVYTYSSNEPGDLTFSQGDIVVVTKTEGDWWTGTFGDKQGIFPASYVKKVENQPVQDMFAPDVTPPPSANNPLSDLGQMDALSSAFPSSVAAKSPFPEDPFKELRSGPPEMGSGSLENAFSSDPFKASSSPATLGPDTLGNSFSADPFKPGVGDAGPDHFKASAAVSPAIGSTPTANAPSDPFKDFSISGSGSPFAPSQPDFASGVTAFNTGESPFPSDPFAEDSTSMKADPFPGMGTGAKSDPFAEFGLSMSSTGNVTTPTGQLSGSVSSAIPNLSQNSTAISPGPKGSPAASDFSLGGNSPFPEPPSSSLGGNSPFPEPPSSSLGGNSPFPEPPSSWFQSVEADAATTSLPTEVGIEGISGQLTAPSLGMDSSIQTSASLQNMAPLSGTTEAGQSDHASPVQSSLDQLGSTSVAGSFQFSLGGLEPIGGAGDGGDLGSSLLGDTASPLESGTAARVAPGAPAGGQKTLKKPEIATVIAPYTATGPEQLSLSQGQLIQVRKKSASGWWEGELQARGQKRKIGWFPANYVKMLGASARSTPDTLGRGISPSSVGQQQGSNPSPAPHSSTPQPPQPSGAAPQLTSTTPQPQPQSQKYVDHVIALFPYTAQNDDELTFQKDAVINVVKKDDPDWWKGEYNGQLGMFPSNYVSSTSPAESTSWSSDPQVLAITSTEEGKRQTCIHELINTEETYMADMSIVLDAFYKPLAESMAISEDDLQAIFVNWKELILCNNKLLKALRVRKKMSGEGQVINIIGDILCENIPHFSPYIRFCSCQLNAAALIQRLTENNSQFVEIQKLCVQNSKTKGMPLSSFLLKPMQRITKYPLMVERILKYTPVGHPDHTYLTDALEHTTELCSQVNEGVREKENSDRLEWIQQRVHCDALPEKITFNSGTNCLGPRKLLHTGIVYKVKSNKELAVFLFNDFMLLATPNRPLGNSALHSVFDITGQMQYKMYKTPVFLNEVMVKRVEADSDQCQFQVSHIERVYNLRATNATERDMWVKQLSAASRNYLDTEKKKREKAHSSPKASGVGRLLVIVMEGSNLAPSEDVRRSPGMGRLLVVIQEGRDLKASNVNGKSDPYCEVSMGSQEHKTKVIPNTLNPKWSASMQFSIRNVEQDTLCITVFDRDLFSPNNFLGRTEIGVKEIMNETGEGEKGRRPIVKHLLLHETHTGEVIVKLDLHLFDAT